MENRKILLTSEEAEKLESFVYYYANHGVEHIQETHPGFLVDDATEILTILARALELNVMEV